MMLKSYLANVIYKFYFFFNDFTSLKNMLHSNPNIPIDSDKKKKSYDSKNKTSKTRLKSADKKKKHRSSSAHTKKDKLKNAGTSLNSDISCPDSKLSKTCTDPTSSKKKKGSGEKDVQENSGLPILWEKFNNDKENKSKLEKNMEKLSSLMFRANIKPLVLPDIEDDYLVVFLLSLCIYTVSGSTKSEVNQESRRKYFSLPNNFLSQISSFIKSYADNKKIPSKVRDLIKETYSNYLSKVPVDSKYASINNPLKLFETLNKDYNPNEDSKNLHILFRVILHVITLIERLKAYKTYLDN